MTLCAPSGRCSGRVTLETFESADQAIAIVGACYARLADEHPDLAANVSPATDEDLRHWQDAGQMWAIRAAENTVGVLAVAPGSVTWIDGYEINEEVVLAEHRGHGYAAAAQQVWAQSVADVSDGILVGTINRLNAASRRTAGRAGRPPVMETVFIGLD